MVQEEITVDVLVAGTGASGMSAAVTAASQGLEVLVVDKEARYGGTTARSGGWLWIPGTRLATEQKGSKAYNRSQGDPLVTPNPCVAPLQTAPYYAIRLVIGDIGTFAGLATDENARVLDASGKPIRALYAVGNDAASVMGGNYPGAGITLGPALTFGYIAAMDLAKTTAAESEWRTGGSATRSRLASSEGTR